MAKKRQLAWTIERGVEPFSVDAVWFVDGVPLVNDQAQVELDCTEMSE